MTTLGNTSGPSPLKVQHADIDVIVLQKTDLMTCFIRGSLIWKT